MRNVLRRRCVDVSKCFGWDGRGRINIVIHGAHQFNDPETEVVQTFLATEYTS